jgi:hypothetical protein
MSSATIFRRLGYGLSFLIVAGVAAVVSYTHIRDVAVLGHQPALVADLLPLSIDGLMLIATLAMAEDKAASRRPRPWARFGFWFGAAISVTANVASTAVTYPGPLAIGVAAAAPLVLLVAVEIVSRPGKPRTTSAISPRYELAELESPELAAAPVSPAVMASAMRDTRAPYGPRNGERYSERHERRQRNGR